jgi:hypothetical protein
LKQDRQRLRIDPAWQAKIMGQIEVDVVSWADQFNLRGRVPTTPALQPAEPSLLDWMSEIIVSTLLEWQSDRGRSLKWGYLPDYSVHAHLDHPGQLLIRVDGWPLERETETAFKERVHSQLESQLQEYVEKRRRQVRGLLPMPPRLARSPFAYLAFFQCLRRSHTQIARQFKRSRSAVSEGIRTAAEAVVGPSYKHWLMPPLPAGRPGANDPPR